MFCLKNPLIHRSANEMAYLKVNMHLSIYCFTTGIVECVQIIINHDYKSIAVSFAAIIINQMFAMLFNIFHV